MAFSFELYNGDGTTTDFAITFDYLDPDHVEVSVDGVSTSFTFQSSTLARISPAPSNGTIVRVARNTPKEIREVVWQNASNLGATDLNTSDLQLLYIVQEAFDASDNRLGQNLVGLWDATSKRIVNLATGVAATDAATVAQVTAVEATVQSLVDEAEDFRDESETFRDTTLGYRNEAEDFRDEAETFKDGAEAARDLAEDYRDTALEAVGSIKVSSNDTTSKPLEDKLLVGTGLALSTQNDGGDETRTINLEATGARSVLDVYSTSEVDANKIKQAATVTPSGTEIPFTGIDSAAKRITVQFVNVTTASSTDMFLQIGDSGGLETSGYVSDAVRQAGGAAIYSSRTDGYNLEVGVTNYVVNGKLVLTRLGTSNVWECTGLIVPVTSSVPQFTVLSGHKTISDVIDRLSIKLVSATTFSGGSVNLLIE